jgi:hypothetical protein
MKTITLEMDDDVFAELRSVVLVRHQLGYTGACKLTQFVGLVIQAIEGNQACTYIMKKEASPGVNDD